MAGYDHIFDGRHESEPLRLVHEILILDAFLKKPLDFVRHVAITREFVAELLNVLGMEALGPLGIYPALDQRAPGWSFIQPITTSHVSAHYFEKPGRLPHIRLDAYSCESVDYAHLVSVCHKHFSFDEWHANFIVRELDNPCARSVVELSGHGSRVLAEREMTADANVTKRYGS